MIQVFGIFTSSYVKTFRYSRVTQLVCLSIMIILLQLYKLNLILFLKVKLLLIKKIIY